VLLTLIFAGLWLLRILRQQPAPNRRVALVVGAVFATITYLLPVGNVLVGFAVIVLPVGGLLGGWFEHR